MSYDPGTAVYRINYIVHSLSSVLELHTLFTLLSVQSLSEFEGS